MIVVLVIARTKKNFFFFCKNSVYSVFLFNFQETISRYDEHEIRFDDYILDSIPAFDTNEEGKIIIMSA